MGISHFQQDNLAIHNNSEVTKIIDEANLKCMKWPPYSPDCNPIENVWSILKNKVAKYSYEKKINDEEHLWNIIKQSWEEIPKEHFKNLVNGMPRRIKDVLDGLGEIIDK